MGDGRCLYYSIMQHAACPEPYKITRHEAANPPAKTYEKVLRRSGDSLAQLPPLGDEFHGEPVENWLGTELLGEGATVSPWTHG